jgi:pSer/pThr/pTyr-binding forkhead associated (FHA) protein
VSASHLEIRQLGASVVVTDLRSTNGSVVAVPGSAPHTLRQGESMVVTPGTLVDIGDGNVIEILPLQRHPHVGAVQHDTSEGVA